MTLPHRPVGIVTGPAGIGFKLARPFAKHGYDLIATGRSAAIYTAADDFRRHGIAVTPVQADLGSYDGVEGLWEHVTDSGRAVGAAIVNADIGFGGAPFVNHCARRSGRTGWAVPSSVEERTKTESSSRAGDTTPS